MSDGQTYCGPLGDAGETEQVLAALWPPHGLQLEPQQADWTPLCLLIATGLTLVTVLVVGHVWKRVGYHLLYN